MEIVKLYKYRQAMVSTRNGALTLPREMLNTVADLIPQGKEDNHQVVVIKADDWGHKVRWAIWFHDFHAIVGREEDIVEGDC